MTHEKHIVTFQAYDQGSPDVAYNTAPRSGNSGRLRSQRSLLRFVIEPPLPVVYDPQFLDTATQAVVSQQQNVLDRPVQNVTLTHSDEAGTYGSISVPERIVESMSLRLTVQEVVRLAFREALSPLEPELVTVQFPSRTKLPELPEA